MKIAIKLIQVISITLQIFIILTMIMIILSCNKKTCWDCVARDTAGKVIDTSTACDQEMRDWFLNTYSNSECYPL